MGWVSVDVFILGPGKRVRTFLFFPVFTLQPANGAWESASPVEGLIIYASPRFMYLVPAIV